MSYLIYLYSLALIAATIGILANTKSKKNKDRNYSIVIVARNEQDYLPFLLQSLSKLKYPDDMYEVILVDDGSQDDTNSIMTAASEAFHNYKVIKIDNKQLPGKKQGLQTGLETAKHEILLLTDADCIVSPDWLEKINEYWNDETAMLIGFAPEISWPQLISGYYADQLKAASLENLKSYITYSFRRFVSLVAAGIYAASAGLKIPFSCAGRNLAVRRELLHQLGGYTSFNRYKSGDDKQALNLIKKNKGVVRYCPAETVNTLPGLGSFHRQQKRRFGKIKISSPFFALVTIMFMLFYLYLPFYLIFNLDYTAAIMVFGAAILIWSVNLLKHRQRLRAVEILFLLVYPYYFIYFTLIGSFLAHKWKD